jgi:hypothetical protein
MMFSRNDALPVHGGSRKNNGVSLPAVNVTVSTAAIRVFIFSYAILGRPQPHLGIYIRFYILLWFPAQSPLC